MRPDIVFGNRNVAIPGQVEAQMQKAVREPMSRPEARAAGSLSHADMPVMDTASSVNPSTGSALAWAGLGFLVGAVFWHFIGFWGFVSSIVLSGQPTPARLVEQTGPACVELVLDRATDRTAAMPCPDDAPLLAEGARAERQDFAGPRDRRSLIRTSGPTRFSARED